MSSTTFMSSSIACCKLPSPSFWIAERFTLSGRDNASLTWTGSILLFVNVQEFSSSSKYSIKVSVKGKIINLEVGYGFEIPAEYIFYCYSMGKESIRCCQWECEKKALRCLK